MPQPTAAPTLNASYLEASKALARPDVTASASASSSPSPDFGQLFARVHAASNGQQFAAVATQTSVSGLGSSASMDLRRFDSASSWQGPRYEPQDPRQSRTHHDRQDDNERRNRQTDSRVNRHTLANDTAQPTNLGRPDQTKASLPVNRHPTASEAPALRQGRQAEPTGIGKAGDGAVPASATTEGWPAPAALAAAAQILADAAQPDPGSEVSAGDIMAVELAGGMQIITPTHTPNDASLAAFAKAQGMSAEAVAMLLKQAAGQATHGGGLLGQTTAQWMTHGAGAPVQADAALQAAMVAMGQGASELSELGPDALKQQLQAQAQPTHGAPTTAALTNAIGGQALALAQQQAALLGGGNGKLGAGHGTSPVSAQVAAQMLASGLRAEAGAAAGAAAGAPGSNTSTALAAQAMALAGVSEEDIHSLLRARGATGASTLGSESTLGGLDKVGAAVPRAVQPMGVVLGAPSAAIAQRTELYQNIANRLGEAMGARIAGQIAKGQWSMQLTLKPANLGAVDVDLSMRNGELEAKFTAANPLTRDLLQDSLPKLREALSQAGTNIAYVDVNGESGQKNHGNPTPQHGVSAQLGGRQAAAGGAGDGLSSPVTSSARSFDGDGPLNVWA